MTDTTTAEARRVAVIRAVSAGSAVVNTVFALVYVVLSSGRLTGLGFGMVAWNAGYIAVVVGARHHTDAAGWVLLFTTVGNLTTVSVVVGRGTGVFLYLLLVPMFGVLVGRPESVVFPLIALVVAAPLFAVTGAFFVQSPSSLDGSTLQGFLFLGNAVTAAVFSAVIVFLYRRRVEVTAAALAASEQAVEMFIMQLSVLPTERAILDELIDTVAQSLSPSLMDIWLRSDPAMGDNRKPSAGDNRSSPSQTW